MLYQIEGTNTRIMGTLHRVPPGKSEWNGRVVQQCKWAEQFAVEMLLSKAPQLFCAPTDRSVSLLPQDLREKLKALWPAHLGPFDGANLPGAALLASIADTPTDPGVEYLVENEASDIRPIHELEDAAEFIAGFAAIPASQYATAIRISLKRTADHRAKRLQEIYECWNAGDGPALYAALTQELPPAFIEPMFIARNTAWTPKIAALSSRPERLLICVGAGHLCGPKNVLELLHRDHHLKAKALHP